jgi:hypothetical protein
MSRHSAAAVAKSVPDAGMMAKDLKRQLYIALARTNTEKRGSYQAAGEQFLPGALTRC